MGYSGIREEVIESAPIPMGLCAELATLRDKRFAHLLWHGFGFHPRELTKSYYYLMTGLLDPYDA